MSYEEKKKYASGGDPRSRRDFGSKHMPKIISEVERKLQDALKPETLVELNSFERKLVHRHFDHNSDFQTRTYRDGDKFILTVYPVGNIERFAKQKAQESVESGDNVHLPPMGSYERYVIHAGLKDVAGVETVSQGEGSERHVMIVSKKFGRGLKKIVKKIKLF